MKLCFVTPKIGNDLAGWKMVIEEVVAGGADMIQIRDKKSPKSEILEAAKAIQPLLKKNHIALIINDYIDIALTVQADGVHLGQSDGSVQKARRILGTGAIIGLSVENLEQAFATTHENVTYLAASPVFTSTTKRDCSQPWGLAGLKQLCAAAPHPIFAIGGIDLDNIGEVIKCGVAGIAVVSAIAHADCPKTATERFKWKLHKYNLDARERNF